MAGFNSVTRVYRQRDTVSRAFGIGMTHPYDMFIVGNLNDFSYVELVLPNGSRVRFDRTSGNSWSNSTLQSVTSPGKFYGAVFSNKNGWTITLRDGTAFTFIQPGIFGPSKYQDVGLTSITDRNGNTLKVIRDSSNYVSRLVSQNGRWMQFTYDSSHRITAAQDNLGRIVQYSYDSQGRLNQLTDANNGIWSYGWDSVNIDQMTSITDPKQTQFLLNHYDVYGRVDRQTQADGTNFRFDYILDSNNNVVQTQVTDPNGNGRIVTFPPPPPSPDGAFVFGGYMANDTRTVGPERQVFTYQRDPSTNLLLSVTDSLNRQTTFTYDGVGNVTSITRLAGTPNAVTTSFAYESTFSQISSITDPLQHKTSFGYDGKGNLTSVTDPVSSTSSFSYNNLGRLVSAADPLGNSLQIVYSGADVSSIIGPSGGNVGAVTDGAGRLTALSDPLGNTTRYQYNALNRLTQQTDALGGVVSLQFDANSNLLNASDPRNAQAPTTYAYDNMDRIQTRIDELGDSTTFVHDGNGNLTCVTDRRGKISVFQYDGLNRLVLAGFGASSCASTSYESTIAYSYDAAGRPTSIVDSVSGTMTPTFDGLDRLASLTTPQGSISYQYDAANREVAMAVRGQPPVTYSYEDAGRLTNIIQGTSSIGLGYDATGRRTALTLPNGVSLTYSYDTESRLASITYRRGTTLLGDLTYSYDTAGAVSKLGGSYAKTELPMAVTSATYDAANRLTNWGGTSLAYDANGNLLSDGANTYAWDARNHAAARQDAPATQARSSRPRRAGGVGSTVACCPSFRY